MTSMGRTVWVARIALRVIGLPLVILFLAEGMLWGALLFSNSRSKNPFFRAMDEKVQPRIDRQWLRSPRDKDHPFEPPFRVFFNSGYDEPMRMREIFEATQLPPGKTWMVPNFLRNPAENTTFRVTSNRFGFRDVERSRKKPPGTFRIIALGSYPTFGHGVNDDETYAHRLEKTLNSRAPKGQRYEVWNGGRQGGTAIMGLSRLEGDVMDYDPDLLIWDFGWIELYLKRDFAQQGTRRNRVRELSTISQFVYAGCATPEWKVLLLCQRFRELIGSLDRSVALASWENVNWRMIEFVKKQKLPVLILHHAGVAIPAKRYQKFSDPDHGIYFVDTEPVLRDRPVSKEDVDLFWSKETNWLSEIGVKRSDVPATPEIIYRTDAIQYNEIAFRIMGDYLAEEIEKRRFENRRVN